MRALGLLAALTTVWLLWAAAVVAERYAAADSRGVSLAPVLPLFPLLALGIALGVDVVAAPWGTRIVATTHVALAMVFAGSTARSLLRGRPR